MFALHDQTCQCLRTKLGQGAADPRIRFGRIELIPDTELDLSKSLVGKCSLPVGHLVDHELAEAKMFAWPLHRPIATALHNGQRTWSILNACSLPLGTVLRVVSDIQALDSSHESLNTLQCGRVDGTGEIFLFQIVHSEANSVNLQQL